MPIDIRFDDLDLRVEPHKGTSDLNDPVTGQTLNCTRTQFCSAGCCTDGC
jgi:hypothetical protein